MRYLEIEKFHYLFDKNYLNVLRFLFSIYYRVNIKYYKKILYSKSKKSKNPNQIFINKLIKAYPNLFNYILALKLVNINLLLNKNDFYIMKYLLDKISIKFKYYQILVSSNKEIIDFLFKFYSNIYKETFLIYIIYDSEMNEYEPTHIAISYKNNLYNILDDNAKIYAYNISCVINSYCFLLENLNINFDINNIICIFYILQNCLNFNKLKEIKNK